MYTASVRRLHYTVGQSAASSSRHKCSEALQEDGGVNLVRSGAPLPTRPLG